MTKNKLTRLFWGCRELEREARDWLGFAADGNVYGERKTEALKIGNRLWREALSLKTKINLGLNGTGQATGKPKRYADLIGLACHNCKPIDDL